MTLTNAHARRAAAVRAHAVLAALAVPAALAVLAGGIVGCGPDARRDRAMLTVQLASRSVLIVEDTSGSEDLDEEERAVIEPARADAAAWVEQSEQSIDVWTNSGSLAFATVAPCLGRSLGRLRERLARYERPIPESLRRAEALARSATDGRCTRRRTPGVRTSRARQEPTEEATEEE